MRKLAISILTRITIVILLTGTLTLVACDTDRHATVYTPVEKLKFADPVLKTCVMQEAKSQGWKTSGQITRLVCTNPEGAVIERLDGIENLVNLLLLDLAHNSISDIHLIGRLKHLERLDLGYNRIQTIEFSRLRISLRTLNLDHNMIADISWLPALSHIEDLSISHNRLQDIQAVAALTDLESLDLSNNQIVSITPLESLRVVRDIDIGNNLITDIRPLGSARHLLVLHLNGNQISSVTGLADLSALEELDLSNNQLTHVAALADFISLHRLNLSKNQISDIQSLEGLGAIESINVKGNPLDCNMIKQLISALGQDTVVADSCTAVTESLEADQVRPDD